MSLDEGERVRKLSSTEVGALLLAGFFVVAGCLVVLHPREGVVQHPTMSPTGGGNPESYLEYLSKGPSRFYGGVAILIGGGIAALALYPRK